MNIKKYIIIFTILYFTSISMFSRENKLDIPLNVWDKNETYSNQESTPIILKKHTKSIKETTFNLPESSKNQILYLKVKHHTGFSYIYINGYLLTNLGHVNHINSFYHESNYIVPIPESTLLPINLNKIKVINYSENNEIIVKFTISKNDNMGFLEFIMNKAREFMPLSYSLQILILIYLHILFTKKSGRLSGNVHITSLSLLFVFFILSGIKDQGTISHILLFISNIVYISSWILFIYSYLKRNNIVRIKQLTIISFIFATTILSVLIIYYLGSIQIKINSINRIIGLCLNILLLIVAIKHKKKNEGLFIIGLSISIVLTIIELIIKLLIYDNTFGFIQTGIVIVCITYLLSDAILTSVKINSSKKYSNKLLVKIDKVKDEIIQKDNYIAELKSKNEEVTREKALFFNSLSNNLRTPLNSIIGYSENLYTTEDINEVHRTVSDIILESDKIFQSINNILDFSSKDFSDSDLLVKDFRMKEIFDNSVYSSPAISAYSKKITYKVINNCDKIIITGNPRIYKKVISNVLQYLINLIPKEIEYIISGSKVNDEFMNLEVQFIAKELSETDLSMSNNKEIFTKYVKLYGVEFNEELKNNNYFINLRFQCQLASIDKSPKIKELATSKRLDKSLHVLVVEDYLPNLKVVEIHLEKMGCNVFKASNGEDAVKIFNDNYIDLILMDISMPIMDGWEATEIIRSTKKGLDVFIIGLTASSMELDIRHCFEAGMDDVQVKPIRKNQLYNKLQNLEKLIQPHFSTLGSLQADYGISKIEADQLFSSSVKQIEKQLEVIEILAAADDMGGLEKEKPAILNAASNINAFYFSRLLRNLFSACKSHDKDRQKSIMTQLREIIIEVMESHSDLFRN